MEFETETNEIQVGVVGLGLMGSSIVVALLVAGHPVSGVAPLPGEVDGALQRIKSHLRHCQESNLLSQPIESYLERLTLSEDYQILNNCRLVQECVVEIKEIKAEVYRKIHEATREDVIVSSNTSAIPISMLQELSPVPERFLGIHWAEPAYLTRFLEITKGQLTSDETGQWVFQLAHSWDKEPTFLQKDVRGFVTNRLMYAVYREIFHLIEKGETNLEDVDKAWRYDAGSWMTFMGIFRRMDYLGLEDFPQIFRNIFPKLNKMAGVPEVMRTIADERARGIQDGKGLFTYTREEAKHWEEAFAAFNKDIFRLAEKYPSRALSDKPEIRQGNGR